MPSRFARSLAPTFAALIALLALATGASAADQTVAGNQFVIGKACIGPTCDNTVAPTLPLHLRNNDTPAIRFDQGNGGGFTAQVWDVAGNEANFFVRDATNGSKLPFRVRPGAPTSAIDILSSGYTTASQQFALNVVSTNVNPLDPSTVVSKLGSVGFETYESTGTTDTQYRPNLTDLSAQFGGSTSLLNPASVASLALAGVKKNAADLQSLSATVGGIPPEATALATRVSTLETQNASLKKSNTKLTKQYKSLAKSLKALQKKVRKLR